MRDGSHETASDCPACVLAESRPGTGLSHHAGGCRGCLAREVARLPAQHRRGVFACMEPSVRRSFSALVEVARERMKGASDGQR